MAAAARSPVTARAVGFVRFAQPGHHSDCDDDQDESFHGCPQIDVSGWMEDTVSSGSMSRIGMLDILLSVLNQPETDQQRCVSQC